MASERHSIETTTTAAAATAATTGLILSSF